MDLAHRHLSGWKRLAIIASVLWVIGAGYISREHDLDRAADAAILADHICEQHADLEKGGDDYRPCRVEFDAAWRLNLADSWWNAAFVAFAPLTFFWLFGYGVRGAWRWVLRGFREGAPS